MNWFDLEKYSNIIRGNSNVIYACTVKHCLNKLSPLYLLKFTSQVREKSIKKETLKKPDVPIFNKEDDVEDEVGNGRFQSLYPKYCKITILKLLIDSLFLRRAKTGRTDSTGSNSSATCTSRHAPT